MSSEIKTPWLKNYGGIPFHITYPEGTMCEAVFASAEKYPEAPALSFMGQDISYKKLKENIILTAKSFCSLGIKEGDRVTICLPNIPQAVYALYAFNLIGALVCMIHPLSAEGEIEFYLRETASDCVVTLDQFGKKFDSLQKNISIGNIIITSISDALNPLLWAGYMVTQGYKIRKMKNTENVTYWNKFLSGGKKFKGQYKSYKNKNDAAVILFSGGTTGVTKGILLSNLNFNALAKQTETMCNKVVTKKSMLAAMPMFHGFGLGVCVHTILVCGGRSILIPRFNVDSYAKLLNKEKPNYIAGVPTLYEAITRSENMRGVDLSCLMGVFSGGDSLSIELKKKFDKFLAEHNAAVKIREGYGTTECVTASCLTPYNIEKQGSIGLPYPDTYYKICKPGTTDEVPYGVDGEICIYGPTVMLGYLNHPKETAETLKLHDDGNLWLHTGDMGNMDEDGFIYFKQRIKRMIITSGYNVYPSHIENIIDAHDAVQMSCVIGIRDEYKMQKVKAFIVLKPGYENTRELRENIFNHCKKNIAKYAMPAEIEIRDSLPKTLVGKVAYTVLEKEEEAKIS